MTLKARIILGISTIVALGGLLALVAYAGFSDLRALLFRLSDIEQPSAAAAYEMEINTLGIAVGVLSYWEDGDPQARARVLDDESDFEQFHSHFLALAHTPGEKEVGRRVEVSYLEFKELARSLMDKRDERGAFEASARARLDLISGKLQSARAALGDASDAGPSGARQALSALGARVAAATTYLDAYARSGGGTNRRMFAQSIEEGRAILATLVADPGNSAGFVRALQGTDALLLDLARAEQHIARQRDAAREERRRFLDLRERLDTLLDEEIQVLTRADVEDPRKQAEQAAQAVLQRTRFLALALILVATALGVWLIGGVNRRVTALLAGTRAISAGDLDHRVMLPGEDELSDLARQFNEMVEKLRATTVSRDELEASELKLRVAVTRLQAEAAERLRAEEGLRLSEERLRALSGRVIEAQEAERLSIARDLHDEVGQCLTAVRINLIRSIQMTPAGNACAMLAETIEILDETVRRIRDLSVELRPPMLDDLGLAPAIRWLLDSRLSHAGLKWKLEDGLQPGRHRDRNVVTTAFRVTQEALTNVVRHASARHVHVAMREDGADLVLVILDDGVGFDVQSARRRAATGRCLGMIGMEERVRLLGGAFSITSTPRQGTEISLRLPLARDSAAKALVAAGAA